MIDQLLLNNRRWAATVKQETPNFFVELSKQQTPQFFWVGCCDSRVPANQIIGLMPGEVFVHRNIANIVNSADINCISALQYAVDVLKVQHVILCGHYGCGGVEAAIHGEGHDIIDYWIWDIKAILTRHEKLLSQISPDAVSHFMCEVNVIEQTYELCRTKVIREAWQRQQPVSVHGWVYGIHDGLLQEVIPHVNYQTDIEQMYDAALTAVSQKYCSQP